MELVYQIGDYLNRDFKNPQWDYYRGAIAFVNRAGVAHIADAINEFSQRGDFALAVGIDHNGTSRQGLELLLASLDGRGRAYVFHNPRPFTTFHPKSHIFRNSNYAVSYIGSGNFTRGGLYTNEEINCRLSHNMTLPLDQDFISGLDNHLNAYIGDAGRCRLLSESFVKALAENGYVYEEGAKGSKSPHTVLSPRVQLFEMAPLAQPVIPAILNGDTAFLMTLQRTDVGHGQTTPGTGRRPPEIFIPLDARGSLPEFWGWPTGFSSTPTNENDYERYVSLAVHGRVEQSRIWHNDRKRDFRFRSEATRSRAQIGDLLRVEKLSLQDGADYRVEVIPQDSKLFDHFMALCPNKVRTGNSRKQWGYY